MMSEADALSMAREAFLGSTSYFDANVRPGIERDIRQFQSKHAPDSKYHSDAYRSRSRLFRPKTRAAVRKNEAIAAEAFFSTLDAVSVTATNEQDERQLASADVIKALLEYRLNKTIPWFMLVMGAYQDSMVTGSVASYQYWKFDPDKGIDQPCIELMPIENLRFDPGANWLDPIGTSPYVIRMIPMYVKDVKARMQPQPDGQPAKWTPLDDSKLLSAARNYDTTRMLREEGRADSRDKVTSLTAFTIVWVHQNVVEIDGVDMVYFTLGTEFLLSKPERLDLRYAHGKRPFVLGCSVIETHKVYPGGPVRLSSDVQTEINEVTNQRIDNVKFVLNKRYFVKRNKQVDIRSLTRNVPGSVTLLTDPEGDIKVVDTPDVTGSSFQEHDRLNLDFDEVAGNFSSASVSSNRRLNETVGGLNLLTNDASQLTRYQLKTFVETWVEPVLRQLVLLEQWYETDDTVLALASQKAQLFQRFGTDAMTDDLLNGEMTITVNIGMGATSPNEKINHLLLGIRGIKEALADGTLVKHGVDATEILKEVFGALGHRDGGKFLRQDDDPRIAALQQQVDELQQALDAKHPPELLAAMVREIEARIRLSEANKVKSGVEASFAAMQAGEVIAAVPAVAPVADEVMRVAGYVPPTPNGVDPNFPAAPLSVPAAMAVATGAHGEAMAHPDVQANTSPMLPGVPRTGAAGAGQGIETKGADSVGV